MNRTNIEWAKNPDGTQGYTWNPITGCLNHINGMCKGGNFPCYAYKLTNTRLKERYLANDNFVPCHEECRQRIQTEIPFWPRFWPDRLEQVKKVPKGSGIFPIDMGDLFGLGIPYWWTKAVLDCILLRPDCRFYLLTKQPQNLPQWSPFPDNCWVGVTVANQSMHNEAIVALSGIEAKVKYISYEPLLSEIVAEYAYDLSDINWVIIGAQTKPTVYPKIEWVNEICEAANKAGIPVFLKNNLKPLFDDCARKSGVGYSLRQEIPHD